MRALIQLSKWRLHFSALFWNLLIQRQFTTFNIVIGLLRSLPHFEPRFSSIHLSSSLPKTMQVPNELMMAVPLQASGTRELYVFDLPTWNSCDSGSCSRSEYAP